MASKFKLEKDMGGSWHPVICGWTYDGLAKVCATEAEARKYIASRRGIDLWAEFRIINVEGEPRLGYRPGDGKFHVVCRRK